MTTIASDGPRYSPPPIAREARSGTSPTTGERGNTTFDPERIDNPFKPGYEEPATERTDSPTFDPERIDNPFKSEDSGYEEAARIIENQAESVFNFFL